MCSNMTEASSDMTEASPSPPLSSLLRPEELWLSGEQRSLLDARLFPVLRLQGGDVDLEGGVGWLLGGSGCLTTWKEAQRLSLREVMSLTHQEAELQWREDLLFLAGRRRVVDALWSRSDDFLLPSFRAAVLGGQQGVLLETLDSSESLINTNTGMKSSCTVSAHTSYSPSHLCSCFSCSRKRGSGGGVRCRAGRGCSLSLVYC